MTLTTQPPITDPLVPGEVSEQTKQATVAAGVALRSITKKYGEFTAIENITLDIPAGAYCCLLGPSGCGKTTALQMISGHEEVTKGEVWIGDRNVTNLPPAKRNTAMMFQNYALFPHKTIWQSVEFGLKMKGEIILPLSAPGIAIGSTFVVTLTMGESITVRLMGSGQSASVGKLISTQIGSVQYPLAAANAVILLLVTLVMVTGILRVVDIRKEL